MGSHPARARGRATSSEPHRRRPGPGTGARPPAGQRGQRRAGAPRYGHGTGAGRRPGRYRHHGPGQQLGSAHARTGPGKLRWKLSFHLKIDSRLPPLHKGCGWFWLHGVSTGTRGAGAPSGAGCPGRRRKKNPAHGPGWWLVAGRALCQHGRGRGFWLRNRTGHRARNRRGRHGHGRRLQPFHGKAQVLQGG